MKSADLRVFETVARTGAMSRAAVELNTVQSNVTLRIRALEEDLGQTLFQRTHAGVVLTAAGERLLPFARKAAMLLEDARRAVGDAGTPAGKLLVGALESTAALRLSPLLKDFVAAHPAVDLSLRTGTSCELIEAVRLGELAGAFVCGPVSHGELIAEPYCREELVLLTAPSVPTLEAALEEPDLRIVVLRAGCSYRLRLEAWLARNGVVGLRTLEFGTLEAILSTVGAGLGVTLLPRELVGALNGSGRVACHALPAGDGLAETVFIRRRDAYVTAALQAFHALAMRKAAEAPTGGATRISAGEMAGI